MHATETFASQVALTGMAGASTRPHARATRPVLHLAAKTIGRMPGRFGIARLLGPSYSLRSVVFHNISAQDTPFTRGISVNTTPRQFEAKLQFLVKHYTPVRLEQVLASCEGGNLPERPILVTFDDAYASVLEVAAPLCVKYSVPAVFFVNAACLDNQRLAADNLVCYVVSEFGMGTIAAAARAVMRPDFQAPNSVAAVFSEFFPAISLSEREAFLAALIRITGIDERRLAAQAGLYLTSSKIRDLARFEFALGNHTYSHVHCRSLTAEDRGREIDRNQEELQALSGMQVRSFSIPYGSALDLTDEVAEHLRRSGHQAVFLSESVANRRGAGGFHLDRVSAHAESDADFFLEVEILPRLRAIRNTYFRRSRFRSVRRNSNRVQSNTKLWQ